MGQFRTLLQYEFCKILKRRSTWLTLVLLSALVLVMDAGCLFGATYVDGVLIETHAQQIQSNRANGKALSGRLMDDELLLEMQEARKHFVMENTSEDAFREEYAKYIQAYEVIRNAVLSFGAEPNETDEAGLYQARQELLEQQWSEYQLKDAEVAYWQEQEGRLEQPYVYQYGDGWQRLMAYDLYMLGIMTAFFASICMTGVFYEEHSRKTDQLILCSRLGRKQLYLAKLCAGTLFSLCAGLVLLLESVIWELSIFGPEGFSGMVQLLASRYSLPLTLGEMFLIMMGLFLLITVLWGIVAMVLSEAVHSQVGAMAGVITLTVLQRLLPIPLSLRGLSQLWNYLPANLLSLEHQGVFDPRLVSFGGIRLTIWQLAPGVYVATILILVLAGRRVYCRYQVQGR